MLQDQDRDRRISVSSCLETKTAVGLEDDITGVEYELGQLDARVNLDRRLLPREVHRVHRVTDCIGTPHRTYEQSVQGCSEEGTRGGLKFVQKLVHCCKWLLTETQCNIISVQQN